MTKTGGTMTTNTRGSYIEEIKPCPFCGNEPIWDELKYDHKPNQYILECQNVYCMMQPSMPSQSSKDEAMKWWNRRIV